MHNVGQSSVNQHVRFAMTPGLVRVPILNADISSQPILDVLKERTW